MKLNKVADKLLDLTLNNRLLNFKDTKYASLPIYSNNIVELYNELFNSTKLEFFDIDKFVQSVSEIKDLYETDIPYESLQRHVESKIKKNQIIGYKSKCSVKAILKNLSKKSLESLLEKGLNILYLSFGIIEYNFDKSGFLYQAPVLLVPVKITNTSKNSLYSLELYEEEAIFNQALNYKIELDYKVKIREIADNESLEEYLSYIENTIKKFNWNLKRETKLGLFSFHKLNMYMDIRQNKEYIIENPLIKQIFGIDAKATYNIYETSDEFFNVVDADSSQLEAIKAIRSGESIVLQGPPGTGKSQTITNIISQSLYDGKKILFVSEKLAALNVVYEKLKKNDLAEFCLALHSNKINKKEVIKELYYTLNLPITTVNNEAIEMIYELNATETLLDSYKAIMHTKVKEFDMTPYEIFSNYALCKKVDDFDYELEGVDLLKPNYLKKVNEKILEYKEYAQIVGYNYKDFCFYGYNNLDISKKSKKHSIEMLEYTKEYLDEIIPLFREISKNNINIENFSDLEKILDIYKIIINMKNTNQAFFDITKLKEYKELALKLTNLYANIKISKGIVLEKYSEEIFEKQYLSYYDKYQKEYSGKFNLFNKSFKQDQETLRSVSKKNKSYSLKVNLEILKNVVLYYNYNNQYELDLYPIQKLMGDELVDIDNLNDSLTKLLEISENTTWFESFMLNEEVNYQELIIRLEKIINNKDKFLKTQTLYDKSIIDLRCYSLKDLYKKTIGKINDYEYINIWIKYKELIHELDEMQILKIIDKCILKEVKNEEIILVIQKIYYKTVVDYVLNNVSGLSSFNRIEHERLVDNFIRLDKLSFEVSKARIKSKLSNNKPSDDIVAINSPASIINKEYLKKRKQMSVRELLNNNASFIQTLKPCFLMSPLSVSTYLECNKIKFDLVIFDEASQIFPQDAIGAIYRGSQIVVVGDSKQMPPSNFFNAIETDDESEEESITDYESILDTCASCLKQYSLKWHYRSQNEDLITFSNENFYENKLTTFPSAKRNDVDFGIEFIKAKNGLFNRKTKTNVMEARLIADLVLNHFNKYGNARSIGVIAFSQSQQSAIEKEVYSLLDKNQINYENMEEPLFIKNLETVQGDERDTILFSIGYGYDEDSKFIQNFGPLNREGGERRLNVAITRAKKNVKIVSSIEYSDIDITRTNSVGARLLGEYLKYAKNSHVFKKQDSTSYDFSFEIKSFLEENGFLLDYKVGNSDMKIDICIKDKESNNYVYAIETDGESFKLAKNTRDRERLRKEILEKMGFNVIRIWSTEWYRNEKVAKDILLERLNNSNIHSIVEESIVPITINNDENTFKNYIRVNDEDILESFRSIEEDFERVMLEYLTIEGPILELDLLKRLLPIFKQEKINNQVKSEFELMKAMWLDLGKVKTNEGFIFLDKQEVIFRVPLENDKPRDIRSISIEEISKGMKKMIEKNKNVEKEGLFKSLMKIMGYTRMNEHIHNRFEETLKFLLKTDLIRVNKDIISIIDLSKK